MKKKGTDRGGGTPAKSKRMGVDVRVAGHKSLAADPNVIVTARAEELHPVRPGDLSGVYLRISGLKEHTVITTSFEFHVLGLLSGAPLLRFITEALAVLEAGPKVEGGCTAKLAEIYPRIDGRLSGIDLRVYGNPKSMLHVASGGHVFGAVRGEALRGFLRTAMMRATFGRQVPSEHIDIAAETVRAYLGRSQQDLGQVQWF